MFQVILIGKRGEACFAHAHQFKKSSANAGNARAELFAYLSDSRNAEQSVRP